MAKVVKVAVDEVASRKVRAESDIAVTADPERSREMDFNVVRKDQREKE